MSRGKLGTRHGLDATLLSTSAIGSPAAFSTAIKPPGSFNTHTSARDASLLELPNSQHPHEVSRLSSDNVAGQLSLSLTSEHPHTEGPGVADETSLGILDLENIPESVSLFLTSPRASQDILVAPSSSSSLGSFKPPSTTLSSSPPASMGPLRISGPVGASRLTEQESTGEGEEKVGLPAELLEDSMSVDYSSGHGEDDDEEGDNGEAEGERDNTETPEEEVRAPYQVEQTVNTSRTETLQQESSQLEEKQPSDGFTSPQRLPSCYLQRSSLYSSVSQSPLQSPASSAFANPFSPPPSLPPPRPSFPPGGESAEWQPLEGATESRSPYNPFSSQDDAMEGALMMGDDEFGGVMDSDDFAAHLKEDEEAVKDANKFMLPEGFSATTPGTANLTPTSFSSFSSSLLPAHLVASGERDMSIGEYFQRKSYKIGVLQSSSLMSSSERPQFSFSSDGLTATSLPTSTTAINVGNKRTGLSGKEPTWSLSIPTNETADTTLVATEGRGGDGGEERSNMSTNSKESPSHKHQLTPQTLTKHGLILTPPLLPKPTITTLPSSKDHSALSQQSQAVVVVTSTSSPTTTSSALVQSGHLVSAPQTVIERRDQVLVSRAANLTPVVTVHTPFPLQYQIPRLNLDSVDMTKTPHFTAETFTSPSTIKTKFYPPSSSSSSILPLQTSSTSHPPLSKPLTSLSSPPNSPSSSRPISSASVYLSTTASSSICFAPKLSRSGLPLTSAAPPTTSGIEPKHQQAGMDSGLSTSLEYGLASQYWRPSSGGASTLIFPELSTTELSPPPTDLTGISTMATPSLAHLSGGFNITSSEDPNTTLDSLLGSLPSSAAGLTSFSAISPPPPPPTSPPHSSNSLRSMASKAIESGSFSARKSTNTASTVATSDPQIAISLPDPSTSLPTTSTNESPLSPSPSGVNAGARSSIPGSAGSGGKAKKKERVSNLTQTSTSGDEGRQTQSVSASGVLQSSTISSSSLQTSSSTIVTQSSPHDTKPKPTYSLSPPPSPSSAKSTQSVPHKASSNPPVSSSLCPSITTTALLTQSPSKPASSSLSPSQSATKVTPAVSGASGAGGGGGRRQRPFSPKTEAARRKIMELKAVLDATEFSTTAFLEEAIGGSGANQQTLLPPSENLPGKPSTSSTTQQSLTPTSTSSHSPEKPTVNQPSTTEEQKSKQPLVFGTRQSTSCRYSTTQTVVHTLTTSPQSPAPSSSPRVSTGKDSPSSSSPPSFTPVSATLSTTRGGVQKTGNISGISKSSQFVRGKSPTKSPSPELVVEADVVAVRDIGVGTTPSLHRTTKAKTSSSGISQTTPPLKVSFTSSSVSSSTSSPPKRPAAHSPLSPPSQLTSTGSVEKSESGGSSQPIYTSPRLLPHTSLSPPPPPPTQHHHRPLVSRERRKTPQPNALKVPDSLCFQSPCCVGVTLPDQLEINNIGDRWLQLGFELRELYRNGVPETDSSIFSFPQRCFMSPRKIESIKFSFSPKKEGSYEAVLVCKARLVVTDEKDSINFLQEKVVLKALAVAPLLEVTTTPALSEDRCLNYGVLTAGTSLSLPLNLTNRGTSELPLRLTIEASTLSQLYFSFEEVPPELKPPTSSSPSSSSSFYLHSRPFTTTLVLPPKTLVANDDTKPEVYPIDLNFKSPKNFSNDATPLGSPEEIKAQVNISVEGPNATGVLCSIPVQATVGVARLHVPRSLQALTLSCCEGSTVARDVPFKNAGNITLQISLEFSSQCQHFRVSPDFLEMSPGEETLVNISFSPPSPELVIEGCLMVHVQPHGPSYELRVQGISTEKGGVGENQENLIFCNKKCLYWGGVDLGVTTAEQKLLLQNSFSLSVPLQFSLRHKNQAFQLQTENTSGLQELSTDLPPQTQYKLNLLFSPSFSSVFRNSLDIFDSLHSKKFRIPLCGYGGTSQIEVLSARRSTSGGLCTDLGSIAVGQKSMVKVSVFNSGTRAGFMKAVCFPPNNDDADEGVDVGLLPPLPVTQARVTPSECVLQPQQVRELLVSYQPFSSSDEVTRCEGEGGGDPAPLARLVLFHGDEIVRQRFKGAIAHRESALQRGEGGREAERDGGGIDDGGEDRGGGRGEEREENRETNGLINQFNRNFLADFPGQELVETDTELAQFEVENEELFFEQHLENTEIALVGHTSVESSSTSPPSDPYTTQTKVSTKQALSMSYVTPPKHPVGLKGSSIPKTTPPGHTHTTSATTPSTISFSTKIVSSLTLMLPDVISGQRSESTLDIQNPFAESLHWKMNSIASPFVKNIEGSVDRISKANYSVFWVHERKGTIPPHSKAQALVVFQPHDVGSFSQIWDLQVSCSELGKGFKQIRLSFGGKSTSRRNEMEKKTAPPPLPRVRFTSPPLQSPPHHSPSSAPRVAAAPALVTPSRPPLLATSVKRLVYIKGEKAEFPETPVGGHCLLKVKVCNRDKCQHQFQVLSLLPPFSVDHHSFPLGSRQCARLPVHFSPTRPGVFEALLAIRTASGHQAFSQLIGRAIAASIP